MNDRGQTKAIRVMEYITSTPCFEQNKRKVVSEKPLFTSGKLFSIKYRSVVCFVCPDLISYEFNIACQIPSPW